MRSRAKGHPSVPRRLVRAVSGRHPRFADGALLPSSRRAGPQSWRGFPGGHCAKLVAPQAVFQRGRARQEGEGVPFSLRSVPSLNQTGAVGGT